MKFRLVSRCRILHWWAHVGAHHTSDPGLFPIWNVLTRKDHPRLSPTCQQAAVYPSICTAEGILWYPGCLLRHQQENIHPFHSFLWSFLRQEMLMGS